MRRVLVIVFGLVVALSTPLRADPTTGPTTALKIDPKHLALARSVVEISQGDRVSMLAAMRGPLVAIVDQSMRQHGVTAPDKAKIMTEEVLMPTLAEHYDELLDMQALTFAAILSMEDLRAINAFYATPAGRHFIAARPQLTQAALVGVRQWVTILTPELQSKIVEAAKAHGWLPGSPADRPRSN